MEKMGSPLDNIINSILYLWGGGDNPAEKIAKETIKDSHSDKIKKDLRRINKDFRDSYSKVREEALSLCE